MVQLGKQALDLLERKPGRNVTMTRAVVQFGMWAQIPCLCPVRSNEGEEVTSGWEDNHGRLLNLSEIAEPLGAVKYVLHNSRRRIKVAGDYSLFFRRP